VNNRLNHVTRRAALASFFAAAAFPSIPAAQPWPTMTVHKDPNCGCCLGWTRHLTGAGFTVSVVDTDRIDAIKFRLGVPQELASCHTAEISHYTIEGHVPAGAIARLLAERPAGKGLAVPGMPSGAPGMDGAPERYEVVLFGPNGQRTFGRYRGAEEI
jgi:hypothetical protein